MSLQSKGIGIVFDIDALGGGAYGSVAWRCVMRHLDPKRLAGGMLFHGDTNATLHGRANDHCIAICGDRVDADYVRSTFADVEEPGLCPPERRFIESPQLGREPLMRAGEVDEAGCFVEDEWSRMFHDRCKDTGWGYRPRRITVSLTPELRAELDRMMRL